VKLRTDGGTQARATLDPFVVDDYAAAMRSGTRFPQVVAFHDGKHYWLADGFHRRAAAELAGLKSIHVAVLAGDVRAARLHAAAANVDHGLRRSRKDKQAAVLLLLGDPEYGQWSDRQIATWCGVHHDLVGQLRRRASGGFGQIERRALRNGTAYTMDTSGLRVAPEVRQRIRDTAVAEDASQLRRLGLLPKEQQLAAVELVVTGAAKTIHEAARSELRGYQAEDTPEALPADGGTTIIAGDCVEAMGRLQAAGRRFRLIFADPPYNLGIDYGGGPAEDLRPDGEYLSWCREWLGACAGTRPAPACLDQVVRDIRC
jgi:hypothetical protein